MNSNQIYQDSAINFLKSVNQRSRTRELERLQLSLDKNYWNEIATMGWLGMNAPEEMGGLNLDLDVISSIAQICGQELLPEPIWEASYLPLQLLLSIEDSSIKHELISKIISGDWVIGLALQEKVGDPFLEEVNCTVTHEGKDIFLNGHKKFLRPAGNVNGWLVLAHHEESLVLIWAPADTKGLSLNRLDAVDGLGISELIFKESKIPETNLLTQGFSLRKILTQVIEKYIVLQCAQLIGSSERVLEVTSEYLRTRTQFNIAIGSNQAIQHKMVDLMMELEVSKFLFEDVMRQCNVANIEPHDFSRLVSRLKSRCASTAISISRYAVHFHGAIGTTHDYDIGLYLKRTMFLSSQFGNVSFHKKRFSDLQKKISLHPLKDVEGDINEISYFDAKTDIDLNTLSDFEFRNIVRAFFKKYYPENRRYLPYRQTWNESKDWYMTLSNLGWLAPAWPRAHGGMGLSPEKLIAYIEETEAWGVARCPDQGLIMVGPILMKFGTPEQLAYYLPKILSGEHIWTQGYSEPNAGSDLANIQTSAVIEGDYFRVNGQKTWTTWGQDGTHMFMLVRTDKTVKKQAGISFLLVDLKSAGITIRPIQNLAGETDFCEIFFDNVLVPISNLVGKMNDGWTIAKALLGYERLFTGSPKHSQHTIRQVAKLANKLGFFDDPIFVSKFTDLQLDTDDLICAYTHFASIAKRGEILPPSISILKIWSTETFEKLALLLIEVAQEYAGIKEYCKDIDTHVVAPLFNSMGAKIFAGSNEIQRNILSKTVLNLPQ